MIWKAIFYIRDYTSRRYYIKHTFTQSMVEQYVSLVRVDGQAGLKSSTTILAEPMALFFVFDGQTGLKSSPTILVEPMALFFVFSSTY